MTQQRISRKKLTHDEFQQRREALFRALSQGELTLGQATREMRLLKGMTQKEYPEKVLKIYPRVLQDIERDKGSPTVETLNKIGKPFRLKVAFVRHDKVAWC